MLTFTPLEDAALRVVHASSDRAEESWSTWLRDVVLASFFARCPRPGCQLFLLPNGRGGHQKHVCTVAK